MSLVSSPFFLAKGVTTDVAGQSLRFEDGDSAYLSWTPASAGNRKTWTYSTWIKRGNLGGTQLFGIGSGDSWMIRFSTSDKIACNFANDTVTNYFADSTRVFRDTSAWYHIVVSCDTTQSTASDRVKIYVNGELETITGGATSIPQNRDTDINVAAQHRIGAEIGNRYYSDGYIANACFIDGQQLDPTSFGEYSDTLWRPKSDADIQSLTFGTNGFYLPFKQTTEAEGFSTVTYIGNGSTQGIEGVGFEPDLIWGKRRNSTNSHWLVDSVRGAGKRIISNSTVAEDTPTGLQSSFDSNGFTVGSNTECNASGSPYVAWAWDAGDNLAPTGFSAVTWSGTSARQSIKSLGFKPDLLWTKSRSTSGTNHKWYDSVRDITDVISSDNSNAEFTASDIVSFDEDGFTLDTGSGSNYSGRTYVGWAWDAGSGSPVSNTDGSITSSVKANTAKGFSIATYTGNATDGATIGHGLSQSPDMVIVKDRTNSASWRVMHKDIDYTNKTLYLDATFGETADDRVKAFSSTTFTVTGGGGVNGSARDHVAYCFHGISGYSKFGSYTGTGATGNAITGLGFRPAFLMVKRINGTGDWAMFDNIRDISGGGITGNMFEANLSDAESAANNTYQFNSDGFEWLSGFSNTNASGGTYIYMAFAGGQDLISPVNTDGSIESRVKANTAKGFSITAYVGNGTSGSTFGHGLGVTPEMVIVKRRNNTSAWNTYTSVTGATKYLELSSTVAGTTETNRWNNTAPTSSVVTLGLTNNVNGNGDDYVAYSFASISGYSKIGSYTGTGASGNSITGLGFKPAWLMYKRTSGGSGNWIIHDNTRVVEDDKNKRLYPNSSSAEQTVSPYDVTFDSDGFTMNTTGSDGNASGSTYFYMAFAETRNATFFGDISGNQNNWTPNALNNTDVVPDSPVTGGNFATLNPIQSLYSNSVTTFSEGNLKAALGNASNWRSAVATQQHSSGKWYYEVYANQGANGFIGFGHDNFDINGAAAYAGATAGSWGWLVSGGLYNNTASIDTLSSYTTGDIISIALDFDNAKAYWAKNGIWENSADPAAGTGGTSIDADKLYKMGFSNVSGYASTANFGQDSSFAGNATPQGNTDDNGVGDFYYAPPTGFLALTTSNLPAPAITAPDDYFNTLLWTGDGTSSRALTNVGFQPDFNWVKSRSGTEGHVLHDSVRGSDADGLIPLTTQGTSAESAFDATWHSNFGSLDSLDSDGFTVTDGSLSGTYNTSGVSYVAWNWLAGNSTSSNTNGSITSTISANTTAGFSVGTFTAPSSYINFTTGHGLTAAPEMVILKRRDSTSDWWVWHKDLPNAATGRALKLNSTSGEINGAYFDQSNMTATTVGYTSGVFIINGTYVQYIFHSVKGYSKIGSYTGNGSADGPFVHCGFRPAFLIVKSTGSFGWITVDAKRDPDNGVNANLFPHSNVAEDTTSNFVAADFTANGFKIRTTSGGSNTSAQTYIFYAVAEAPFKSANAR